VHFQKGVARAIDLPATSLYIVNTGKPQTTTGVCVMEVAKQFEKSEIWSEFGQMAAKIEEAITSNDMEQFKILIRHNHRLLTHLGVVPKRVQAFISELEAENCAAKICGAGATTGESSGVVLVLADEPPTKACERYGYSLIVAQGESVGARLVS
jgi:mevalonate kinase